MWYTNHVVRNYKLKGGDNLELDITGFLIGTKFGDGSFVKKSENHNTYIVFSHCDSQIEYLTWKYDLLKGIGFLRSNQSIKLINPTTRNCYKTSKKQFKFSTKSLHELNKFKEMTKLELIENMTEISIAIFILDDGNIYNKTCKISCCSFSEIERIEFIKQCWNKFGLRCVIYNHPTNPTKDYFRFASSEFEIIKDIILKCVPCDLDIIKNKIGG